MFLRILSKNSWFRGIDGEKIKPLKRKMENQKVLCFKKTNSSIIFEEKEIEVKMISKNSKEEKNTKILQKLISTENGNDLIISSLNKENNFLTINDEGEFEFLPFDSLKEETSLVCYEKDEEDNYSFSDISLTESYLSEVEDENGNLANHIFFIPDGYGIVINDFLIN